jgi:hypothetical protein
MTQRRLPAGFNTADENDIIQKGPGGIWVTRSPAEVVGLPATGVSYAPSVAADWTDPDPTNVAAALDTLRALTDFKFGVYSFNTAVPVTDGNRFPLTLGEERGGFTVASGNTVSCPGNLNSRHIVWMTGFFRSASSADPTTMTVIFSHGGEFGGSMIRHSTNVNESLNISLVSVFERTMALKTDGNALTGYGSLFVLKLV